MDCHFNAFVLVVVGELHADVPEGPVFREVGLMRLVSHSVDVPFTMIRCVLPTGRHAAFAGEGEWATTVSR